MHPQGIHSYALAETRLFTSFTLVRLNRYAEILEINMSELKEPVLCAPNDPDDARLLSEVQGTKIDEVFIGSCMTNIGHFRAAGKLLERYNVRARHNPSQCCLYLPRLI